MSGLILGGDVYFDRLDDDSVSTGRIYLGNVTRLSVTEAADEKTRESRGRDTYGNALDTFALKKPTKFNIEGDDFFKATLEIALFGTTVSVNQVAGSITDEVITARHDAWVKLSVQNLQGEDSTAAPVVTNSAASTTYAEGVDYEVDYRLGMIKALSTGAITNGQSLKVDAEYGAVTRTRIRGGVTPRIKGELFCDGKNLITGEAAELLAYRAAFVPSATLDLINTAGDFVKWAAGGTFELPADKTEAYVYDTVDID